MRSRHHWFSLAFWLAVAGPLAQLSRRRCGAAALARSQGHRALFKAARKSAVVAPLRGRVSWQHALVGEYESRRYGFFCAGSS